MHHNIKNNESKIKSSTNLWLILNPISYNIELFSEVWPSHTVINNFHDSCNKKLKSSFKSSHPSNYKFLEVLNELIKANSNDFLRQSNDIETISKRLENRVVPEDLKFKLRDFQITEFRWICIHFAIDQPTANFFRHFEPTLEQIDELPESDEEIIEIEESSPNFYIFIT